MRWEEEIAAREHWAAVAAHAEGKAEGKFEMVKNLLNVGTPIEFIIKATGWSEEQILKAVQGN